MAQVVGLFTGSKYLMTENSDGSVTFSVPPPKPKPKPVIGVPNPVNTETSDSFATISAALGGLRGCRIYEAPGQNVPAGFPAVDPGCTTAVVSFRPVVADVLNGSLDAALAAYFASIPASLALVLVTAWHEGEAHVDTPADFIAMQSHIYPIFKAHAPANAKYGEIHESYTATAYSQYRPLSKWLCCPANGGTLLDFIGIDVYPDTNAATFADTIAPVVAEVTSVIPKPTWAVCECYNNAATTGTDAQLEETFFDGWAWAQSVGALTFFPYFGNAPCFWPPSPAVVSALVAINAASKT
jgi:hypothetical protein